MKRRPRTTPKIDPEEWRDFLAGQIGEENIEKVIMYAKTMLRCARCREILPDDHFYKVSTQRARRGHATICISCYPDYRKGN